MPQSCPRWRNEFGKKKINGNTFRDEIANVGHPEEDPVYGREGPLIKLWARTTRASL